MKCLNCGADIGKNHKFCNPDCRTSFVLTNAMEMHPPKFKVCQNPACGKPLNHIETIVTREGEVRRHYRYDKKFCNRECYNAFQSENMMGKISNFQIFLKKEEEKHKREKERKQRLQVLHKKAMEEIAEFSDPLAMFANVYQGE